MGEVMRKFTIVALAILILIVACAVPGEREIGAGQNGGQVDTRKGEVLVVSLDSNPTTGYRWEVSEIDAAILQQKGDAEYTSNATATPPVPGAGGKQTFRFDVVGTGETTLKLVYRRSWEKGVDPSQTYTVQVTVR
jgi:inhibitor of cysteine peptidase